MSKPPAKRQTKNSPPDQQDDKTLEAEIDKRIGDLIPQQARAQVVAQVTTIMESEYFSGPIAHPRHLREYESICPGSADRIVAMAEDRNRHIMSMERLVVESEIADQRRGMWIGAGLFALLIVSALGSAALGHPAVAGLFLTAAALGGIGVFVKGRNTK